MRFPTGSRARRWALYAAGLVGLGAAVDATLIEPNWIEVVRSVEYLAMLPTVAPDLTLVHLSDIHIGSIGYRERRAIDIINDAQPDIIILSGDLVRGGDRPRDLQTFPLLDGWRGAPKADIGALEDLLLRVSALAETHPEVVELDCNPIVVRTNGVTVIDARVRVEPARPAPPAPSVGR